MYNVIIRNGNSAQYIHRHETPTVDDKIASGTIEEAINAIASFSFVVYPSNPCYNNLVPFGTTVEVYNTNKNRYDFKGRILKVSPQMDSDGTVYKSVVCESRLAYLCDTIQPYSEARAYEGDENRNGLQEFIDVILSNHNEQVEESKRIYRGNVTVHPFATSDSVYKALAYEQTYECINTKLINSFGGEIDIREGEDGLLYLDYVPQFGQTRATKIELAKNIESQSREIDASNIITRLIPLGTKLTVTQTVTTESGEERQEEVETEERLTIASVNGGINYIEDSTAVELYGIIYGTQMWDDVTEASNLKAKGEEWLTENNKIEVSDTISALDLSIIGQDIDDFRIYDSYPVDNRLLGITDTLRIVKKTTNVIEVYASSFTLGSQKKLLTDTLIGYDDAAKNLEQATVDITAAIKASNNAVYYVEQKTSSIEQSGESIRLEVAENTVSQEEYTKFSEMVRNILEMDANGTTMLFNTINEAIAEVDGSAQSNYNNILKYIRFEDGNIILGEVGNEIVLTIANDRLTFLQNGVEVAYLSNNNLYIGNAIIKAGGRLQMGNFAFVPRSDGSLSLLKVGG